jgi:hypothetical protein
MGFIKRHPIAIGAAVLLFWHWTQRNNGTPNLFSPSTVKSYTP